LEKLYIVLEFVASQPSQYAGVAELAYAQDLKFVAKFWPLGKHN